MITSLILAATLAMSSIVEAAPRSDASVQTVQGVQAEQIHDLQGRTSAMISQAKADRAEIRGNGQKAQELRQDLDTFIESAEATHAALQGSVGTNSAAIVRWGERVEKLERRYTLLEDRVAKLEANDKKQDHRLGQLERRVLHSWFGGVVGGEFRMPIDNPGDRWDVAAGSLSAGAVAWTRYGNWQKRGNRGGKGKGLGLMVLPEFMTPGGWSIEADLTHYWARASPDKASSEALFVGFRHSELGFLGDEDGLASLQSNGLSLGAVGTRGKRGKAMFFWKATGLVLYDVHATDQGFSPAAQVQIGVVGKTKHWTSEPYRAN